MNKTKTFISLFIITSILWIPNLQAGEAGEAGEAIVQRGEQISVISFENLPANITLGAPAITLDADSQVNGNLTATGTVCDTNGCIGQTAPSPQEALITFDLPSGFGGGAADTATTWLKRDLNMEIYDTGNIVTLSSSQMILAAGTYRVTTSQVFRCDDRQIRSFQGRLRNITNGTTTALSMTGRHDAPSGTSANMEAQIPPTVFTIASDSTFELQYYIESAGSGANALGHPVSSGESERYAWVYFEKI